MWKTLNKVSCFLADWQQKRIETDMKIGSLICDQNLKILLPENILVYAAEHSADYFLATIICFFWPPPPRAPTAPIFGTLHEVSNLCDHCSRLSHVRSSCNEAARACSQVKSSRKCGPFWRYDVIWRRNDANPCFWRKILLLHLTDQSSHNHTSRMHTRGLSNSHT